MQPTLVGRAEEIKRLGVLLHAARDGQGGSALITGDAGIGKTAIVTALAASADGLALAVGGCSPTHAGQLPFEPWIEILTALESHADVLAVEVPTGVRDAVAPLVRPWEASSGRAGPGAMVAAAADLLVRVATARPVLVVVEDLHWADASSLGLLHHVMHRAARAPVAVLITSRPPTPLPEIARSATLALALTPLSDDDMTVLLDNAVAASSASRPSDAGRIVVRAEGNPFLALHLLRREHVPGGRDDTDVLGVRRFTADPDAARFLVRLAIARDDDDIAAATALPDERLARVTRALVDGGLLLVRDGRLRFRHALIGEEVVALATPAELRMAHADLADASAIGDDARAAALAHHQLAALRWDDGLRSLLNAADHADRVHAHREAQQALSTAREIWPRVAEPADLTGISYTELVLRLGRTARDRGDFPAAHAAWDEMSQLEHDPAGLAYERGVTHYLDGEESAAVQNYERADLLLGATSVPLRGRILAAWAQALLGQRDDERAELVAGEAVDIAAEPWVRINARITRAVACTNHVGVGETIAELRACAADAITVDALDLVLRAYGGLLNIALAGAEHQGVLDVADELELICAESGPLPTLVSVVAPFRFEALRGLGRLDDAVRSADAALTSATFRDVAKVLHAQLAAVAAIRADWPAVQVHLARASLGRTEDAVLDAMLLDTRVRVALHSGDHEGAVEEVRRTLASLRPGRTALADLMLCRAGWVAITSLPSVPPELASQLDTLAAEVAPRKIGGERRTSLVRDLARAERARAYRDPAEPTLWATIVTTLRELDWQSDLPEALLRHAEALARVRRTAEAGRVAHASRAAADVIGVNAVRDAADRLLALLGDPAAPGATGRPMGLTRREMQVLGLLTEGASNREIARTLFISERTAGVHVSNIIGKFGVRNRTQAAQLGSRLTADG